MKFKGFDCVLQIRSLHLTPLDSGRSLPEAGVRPASSAADISLYRGRALLSAGFGEQEQSKRARRRRGIRCLA